MKKHMMAIAILLTSCFIFVACSNNDDTMNESNDQSKETEENDSQTDVINKIEEKMTEVEKYNTEIRLHLQLFDSNDLVIDESEVGLNVSMNESTFESSGEIFENEQVTKYYSTEEATYAQVNDGVWEDMTEQEDDFKHSETDYSSSAQVIIDLKEEEGFEMEERDGEFMFTFKGKSEKVFKALEQPYSLSLSGANIEDVEHDLTIVVDSATYFVDEIKNDLSVEQDEEKIHMIIEQSYDQINTIDDTEIPQEIIDEVAGNINTKDEKNNNKGTFDEEKSRVITQMKEQIDQVNSYETKAELDFFTTDLSTNDLLEEDNVLTNLRVIVNPLQGSGEVIESNRAAGFYSTEQAKYRKVKGEDWQDMTNEPGRFFVLKPTYQDVAQIILDLENEPDVVMEEKDKMYIFTYQGKSESVFKAFEDPYTLKLTGLEPKDMEQDVMILVDSETYFIEHVKNELAGQVLNQEIKIVVDQTYDNFNDFDEIIIPQEVIDEAN